MEQANAQTGSGEAAQTGVDPGDAQTSTSTKEGGLPVGGGSTPGGATPSGSQSPTASGLESVPLEFTFTGNFFDLADFFHDVKRYVLVANQRLKVRGRLMTIDGFKLTSAPETFPKLKAELTATAFLTPKAQGPTAGATPSGPAPVVPAAESSVADGGSGAPPAAAATR